MILDYVGQELIWKLRGNNPYKPNPVRENFMLKCKSQNESYEIKNFFLQHLPKESIAEVIMVESPFKGQVSKVVKEIRVKNVFGEINTVTILY